MKGLFLVRVESLGDECDDPREAGFDSSLRFQPRWSLVTNARIPRRRWWHRGKLGTAEPGYSQNLLCDYKGLVMNALAIANPMYPCIPCVCPSWDNSPRRKEGAIILTNSTPEDYEHWLREVVRLRRERMQPDENAEISGNSLVFINAWNEWAEGNHLEPCQRWGHKYLEATQRALKSCSTDPSPALSSSSEDSRIRRHFDSVEF